eukprot:jgi/Ulvmu1/39/UM001_0042.1
MIVYVASIATVLLHAAVVTGRGRDYTLKCQGNCVDTWKKCAGEGVPDGTIRRCCSDKDHCVEKSSKYGQCRPIDQDIPSNWPSGRVLTCRDEYCYPPEVTSRVAGLSAWRHAGNGNLDIELEYFYADELPSTCLAACLDNPDCVAIDETYDGICTLYDKKVFSLEADLMPYSGSTVVLARCYWPEPLCDPATREVRKVSPYHGNKWMASDTDFRSFHISDTPASQVLPIAINACRLQQHSSKYGGCVGFAMEEVSWDAGAHVVTLLYDFISSDVHHPYIAKKSNNPTAYDISDCLKSHAGEQLEEEALSVADILGSRIRQE